MVKISNLALLAGTAAAWPAVMEMVEKRYTEPEPREPTFLSGRPNTGLPPLEFDAEGQFVDVRPGSGNEFVAPGPNDIRGQCPGLNAAANHGFIPHNGILGHQETIDGLGKAYNMSPDLALFLSVVSVALSGDIIAETWSIGGAFPSKLPILGGYPDGIAGTHNQYESDASIVRGDAYLNGGDVGVFQMRSWEHLWNLGEEYTLDLAAAQSDYQTRWSKANNPYFFQGAFAGVVSAAAHNFVINFMSNRSAENPGGILDRETLKSFFAVTGDSPGNFVHNRGMEKIPFNWYKRPVTNQYTLPQVVTDVQVNNLMYPGIFGVGGNTGKVNTYTGIDLGDLTGGLFNLDTLLEGNNGACFLMQAAIQGLPRAVVPLLGEVQSVLGYALSKLAPMLESNGCPQLNSFNQTDLLQFPGYSYKAEGQTKK